MLSHFKQLIKYRTLIGALVVRHLSIRYRGSLLGFLWSLLNPLILMLVYTLVFSYYMRFDQKNYSVFLFTGLLPWLWLSSALSEGTTSIVSSGHLITKSMFPPNILPFVSVVTNMIHYLLALPLLLIFMLFSRMPFHWTLLLVPFVILIQFTLSYGIALVLSSLNVKFRDIQHLVGNALTFLFFLCPILYAENVVPEKFRFTLDYNPLALLTMAYHDLILYGVVPGFYMWGFLVVSSIILLAIGVLVYEHYREGFAEAL